MGGMIFGPYPDNSEMPLKGFNLRSDVIKFIYLYYLTALGRMNQTAITFQPGSSFFFFFNKFILLFIYLFLAVLGLCCCARVSVVATSGGYSSLWCVGFSLQWFHLLQNTGSRRTGFSSCGTWAHQLWLAGSRAQAQQLWRTGLVAQPHVGSSRTRARTHVPCIGRRILNHCATREVPTRKFLKQLVLKQCGSPSKRC